jgi:sugar (pentulose or hexulose) kinase
MSQAPIDAVPDHVGGSGPYILAIDLGTSGVKLAFVSASTGRIAERRVAGR